MMVLGPRMRERRTALGLSQEAVARKAGLSLNLVNKLENGVVTDPHYSTLSGLARALEVPVEDLVKEELAVPLTEASGEGRALRDARVFLEALEKTLRSRDVHLAAVIRNHLRSTQREEA